MLIITNMAVAAVMEQIGGDQGISFIVGKRYNWAIRSRDAINQGG